MSAADIIGHLARAVADLVERPTEENLKALDGVACDLYDHLDPPKPGSRAQLNGALLAVQHLSDVILAARESGGPGIWIDALATASAGVERAVLRRAA